jgi:tetratricopeptide (TPR) repeat protein
MSSIKNRVTLVYIALFVITPLMQTWAQDAQQQKVIEAIQGELQSFIKKDKQAWTNHWIHSKDARATFASPGFLNVISGWDSLLSSAEQHFATPGETFTATKSDFDVNIQGNIAIVHLKETSGEYVTDQTLVMQNEKNVWKMLKMINLERSSWAATPQAVEANLNGQGYKLMQMNKLDDAIKVFTLNTELYPDAFNTWDSLAEAYMKKGDTETATRYYQKSLELNAENEHARKALSELAKK